MLKEMKNVELGIKNEEVEMCREFRIAEAHSPFTTHHSPWK
jgi:hypothetical protein